jgi:hypothetical protein
MTGSNTAVNGKPRKAATADEIAEMAMRGHDISRDFTGKLKVVKNAASRGDAAERERKRRSTNCSS